MKKFKFYSILLLLAFVTAGYVSCYAGQLQRIPKDLNIFSRKKLSDTKIASGLREALKVGIDKTVTALSAANGYLGNDMIKIPIPEKLQFIEKGLQAIGLGSKVDEFILSMNRSAEKAAPYARDIFIDAVMDMSFEDARAILHGGPTAATDFFRKKTRSKLVSAFRPQIEKTLDKYGVTQKYRILVGAYKAIPLSKKLPPVNIEDYVIDKALDGLFYVLGEQERKIRTDPKARVTELLKEVFK